MAKSATPENGLDESFEQEKPVRNPLVSACALMTAGVLTDYILSLKEGHDSQVGRFLRRGRVVTKCLTGALMVGTIYYCGGNRWQSR